MSDAIPPKKQVRVGRLGARKRGAPADFVAPEDEVESLLETAEAEDVNLAVADLRAGKRVPLTLRKRVRQFHTRNSPPPLKRDYEALAKEMNVWWCNGDGGKYQMKLASGWSEIPENKLVDRLLLHGLRASPDGQAGEMEEFLLYVMEHRQVDCVMEGIAGFSDGVHQMKDVLVLIRRGPRLLVPKKGEFPFVADFIEQRLLLDMPDEDMKDPAAAAATVKLQFVQVERFHGWMQRACQNLYGDLDDETRLDGQVLILAGRRGAAKSRLQHSVITPLLGGRSADPSKYVFEGTEYSSDWLKCEHLLIEDPRPAKRKLDREQLAQILKSLAVNEDHRFRAMRRDGQMVRPRLRVTVSLNDDPDCMRLLPYLTPDFKDKVLMFQVAGRPMPLPVKTGAQRRIFRERINAELPAYLYWLLNEYKVAPEIEDERFGVKYYQHPELAAILSEDMPASELMDLLDGAQFETGETMGHKHWQPLWGTDGGMSADQARERTRAKNGAMTRFFDTAEREGRRLWVGAARDLLELLDKADAKRAARKLADHNSMPRMLQRLCEDSPERVAYHRTGSERLWVIAAPGIDSACVDAGADF